jgi:hypothetical protein
MCGSASQAGWRRRAVCRGSRHHAGVPRLKICAHGGPLQSKGNWKNDDTAVYRKAGAEKTEDSAVDLMTLLR